REAKTLVNLNNAGIPGIPDIYDTFVQDHFFFVVMRFIEGKNLKTWKTQYVPDWQDIVNRFIQVLDTLLLLHSLPEPLIHTDIKPENIIYDDFGKIWLVDFGIAHSIDRSKLGSKSNSQEVFLEETSTKSDGTLQIPQQSFMAGGTIGFSPWEQWHYYPTEAADVYALGMCLYYILVGPDNFRQRKSIPNNHFSPHPGLVKTDYFSGSWPPKLRAVLLNATCANPTERISTKKFREMLLDCLPSSSHGSFLLKNGHMLRTPSDFIDLAGLDWGHALKLTEEESFIVWIKSSLALRDRELNFEKFQKKHSNPHMLLHAFLKWLDPDLPDPELTVTPESIKISNIHRVSQGIKLSIKNNSHGYLPVRLSTSVPWMDVSVESVGLPSQYTQDVSLSIYPQETASLGSHFAGEVTISSAGKTISVPVTIRQGLFQRAFQTVIYPVLQRLRAPCAAAASILLSILLMYQYNNWVFSNIAQSTDLIFAGALVLAPILGMVGSIIGYWLGSSGAVPGAFRNISRTTLYGLIPGVIFGVISLFVLGFTNRFLKLGEFNKNIFYYTSLILGITLAIAYYIYQREKMKRKRDYMHKDSQKYLLGTFFTSMLLVGLIFSLRHFSINELLQQRPISPIIETFTDAQRAEVGNLQENGRPEDLESDPGSLTVDNESKTDFENPLFNPNTFVPIENPGGCCIFTLPDPDPGTQIVVRCLSSGEEVFILDNPIRNGMLNISHKLPDETTAAGWISTTCLQE
ncbi:MAG: AarF/UbiB family protein, partial [Anaerolineaceae bacterium]|nr:AarF/UbiB family protein [Anaerolineaceae bacterium]